MHIVAVVAAAVERVRLHIAPLISGRVAKRFDRLLPLPGLRPNVTGHVKRVRDIWHQFGISLAAGPRIFSKRGALKAMDDVVMHAGMAGRGADEFTQNRGSL